MATLYDLVDLNGNIIEDKLCSTTDSHGLMCPEDKAKLAGIETGANKTVVDTSLSSTSTNPVQNKVVNTAINTLNTNVSLALRGAVYKLTETLPAGSTSVTFEGFYTEDLEMVSYNAYDSATNELVLLDYMYGGNNLIFTIAEAYTDDIIVDVFYKG